MLSTLLIWLFLYGITSVLGSGLIHWVQPRQPIITAQTEIILLGLVGVTAFLQAASIVFPADYRLVIVLVLLALFVNWRLANRPVQLAVGRLRQVSRQPITWLFGLVLLVFATYRPANIDSGMYHLPSIRWYERYQAIPGLGNLHGRLAFNSSFFVSSAAFGFTDVVGQTLVALNGFLILLFGIYALRAVGKVNVSVGLAAVYILLTGLVLYYLVRQVGSPTPDVWGTILPLFVFLLWLDGSPASANSRMLLLVALLFAGLTVKLATIPMLLFLPLIAHRYWQKLRMAHLLAVVGLALALIGPWVVRNVILSGYLIYPLPSLDVLAVDWKIPLDAVRREQDIVTFCARFRLFESHLDPSMLEWPTGRWVRWWLTTWEYYWLSRPLFGLALLSPLLMTVLWLTDRRQARHLLPPYVVGLAGFVFWFFNAPEFRFGYAFVWFTALAPAAFLMRNIPVATNGTRLIGAALGILLVYFVGQRLIIERFPIHRHLLLPQVVSYRGHEMKDHRYEPHQTRSGLVVLMPQPAPYQQNCYDIEKLCSPYFFDDLQQRGVAVEAGFRRRPLPTTRSTLSSHETKHHHSRLQ